MLIGKKGAEIITSVDPCKLNQKENNAFVPANLHTVAI